MFQLKSFKMKAKRALPVCVLWTKVHTVCTVSPVRNSITRNNKVQKRADFSRGENINNF